jgi:hypothetical protein
MQGGPTSPTSPKIGAVVSQAKETASALWVLLHARHCTDSTCRLLHCANAKGIFSLSRAASIGTKLTEEQAGAVGEARKLLTHYKQCRNSRQSNSSVTASSATKPDVPESPAPSGKASTPICLVCSLVARARPICQVVPAKNSHENTSLDFSSSPYDVYTYIYIYICTSTHYMWLWGLMFDEMSIDNLLPVKAMILIHSLFLLFLENDGPTHSHRYLHHPFNCRCMVMALETEVVDVQQA